MPEPQRDSRLAAASVTGTFPCSATRRVLLPIVLGKFATLLLVAAAALLYPRYFSDADYIVTYRGNHGVRPVQRPSADIVFRTWDAEHYLALAAEGYGGNGPKNAYYPLYPALVRALAPMCGGDLLASALLLSTVLGVLGSIVLHDMCVRRWSVQVANWTVLLLCVQPAAFFSVLPYSESLFVFLLASFIALSWRERFWGAASTAALLALTRAIGVLSLVALLAQLVSRRRSRLTYACALLPLLGWGAYFVWIGLETGAPGLGFTTQKPFIAAPSFWRVFEPLAFLRAFGRVTSLHDYLGSFIDRLAFCAYAAALFVLGRRARTQDRDLFALALPFGLVPALSTALMSFTRYLSVVFPVFIVLAGVLAQPGRRALRVGVIALLLGLQLWLLYRHVTHQWAG